MMAVAVRQATSKDATAVFELIQAHALYERGKASCDVHQLATLLDQPQPSVHLLVAVVDRTPVGYASISLDYSLWRCRHWAHLDCLFVTEEHRGAAIGAALFDRAREYAEGTGADQMQWQSPQWNVDAARFYRKHGAVQFPKERFVLSLSSG